MKKKRLPNGFVIIQIMINHNEVCVYICSCLKNRWQPVIHATPVRRITNYTISYHIIHTHILKYSCLYARMHQGYSIRNAECVKVKTYIYHSTVYWTKNIWFRCCFFFVFIFELDNMTKMRCIVSSGLEITKIEYCILIGFELK